MGQTSLQIVVSGLLGGAMFALVALGLTLIFGVMNVINFAHGQILMLAMYATYAGYVVFHIDPVFFVPAAALLFFGLGVAVHLLIVKRVVNASLMAQMFATFGLAMFLGAGAQQLFGVNPRGIPHPIMQGSLRLGGVYFDRSQVVGSIGALAAFGLIHWFLTRTETGLALRATAQDRLAASVMGVNTNRMYAIAWGISIASVGVAGALLANYSAITPTSGDNYALIAYVVVVLGGFGSVRGALLGGVVVGLVQSVGGYIIDPSIKLVLVYAVFLLVIWFRPQGLMGRFA